MAKPMEPKPPEQNIIERPMEEVMHSSMIPYAEHVILERAVPRVEDGMKPVQRRILYTMSELNLAPENPHRKCARIVGDCLGKYHPHGDSSVYDALVRMAQDFSMRCKLVDGHGNFGSVDGDSAAAMRYTEARMTPLAMEMLRDIDKDTVPFRLNFDDTLKEPDMLPARFPNLLVNGASGIAVGLATNIPPHNLREAVNATVAMIDDPDIPLEALMRILPAPDFPTGGVLIDNDEIMNAYRTGRGKLTLRARAHVEDGPAGRKLIVITEVPYQVNKAAMLEKILKLCEERKAALGCIYDIRDESDRTGMRAVVELRKDADAEKVLAYLYKYSDMQITFGVNLVAIADGKPKLLSLRRVLRHYIRHQRNVVTARTRNDLDHARERAHILQGLMIALDHLDEIIALIRASESQKAAKEGLMSRFELDEPQAQAILDMRLRRLTGLEIKTLRKEYDDLLKLIDKLEGILASERKLLNVIKKELLEVADKYGDDRRTTLTPQDGATEAVALEERVAEEAAVVYTEAGYLRRMYPRAYQRLPAVSVENGNLDDRPLFRFLTDTDRTLYLFTNLGNCYQLGVGALQEMNRPKERGSLLTGVLVGWETGEEPVQMLCCTSGELRASPDLLFVTARGMLKRTAAEEYDVRNKRFVAVKLRPDDRVRFVLPLDPSLDMLLITRQGMSIRFHTDTIPAMGRVTAGVRGMNLDDNDTVMFAAQPAPNDQLVLFSERGFAKRVLYLDFEPQARAGKGVKAFYFNKNGSNGSYIAAAALVREPTEALLVRQKKSPPAVMEAGEIVVQGKTDKGKPYLVAVLDDVITGVAPYEPSQPKDGADEGEDGNA